MRFQPRIVAFLFVLFLIPCAANAMKKFPATDFFSGRQLSLAQAVENGDLEKVRQLAPIIDLNTPGRKNMTLLFFAFQEALTREPQQLEIMRTLVEAGADPYYSVPNFGSVLGVSLTRTSPEFLENLLNAGVDPNAILNGDTPILFEATSSQAFELLKLLIARGADVNKRDSLRNTALVNALAAYNFPQVQYLLDHGANPDTYNINGISLARQLQNQMNRQVEGSPFWLKLAEIRDRIIKLGVQWPPEPPEVIRARWGDAKGRVDDSKHVR